MSTASVPRTLLVFEVGGQACALPVEDVQEIVPLPLLAHPPGLPPALEGFLNLRGAAVPVLRLARLFDLAIVPPGLYTPLVILRGEGGPVALLVDRVERLVEVLPAELAPIGRDNCFKDCAEAEVVSAGRTVHLLSPRRLLLERERECLEQLRERAQASLQDWEAPVA